MSKEKKSNSIILCILAIVVVVGLGVMVAWFLLNGTETYESTEAQESSYDALVCTSNALDEPFFVANDVQRYTHELKVLFSNKKLKELSYRYDGTFSSEGLARNAEAWLHADYNKYMVSNGMNSESLNPVFSVNKSKLMISLYAEAKKISKPIARLFFINDDQYDGLNKYSLDDYKKLYQAAGFTCKNNK